MTTLTPSCTPCSRKTQSPSKPRPFPLPLASAQLGETKKITSGESDGFRGHFRPNQGELAGVKVSGDLRGFRGNFRPKHDELDIMLGAFIVTFPSSLVAQLLATKYCEWTPSKIT
ncbi:uncharacterized protein LOC126612238 isoform X1 [Malus sylvestris]|uniref:uncharacterized protein LOC126612238 isoform X1 n=2 Tax=Malus sylvestris TaxID=3752 RepID=UPI0021AC03D1|nr:uncharacterized protein LOC126612238 isoform X1 [Malus sylvestris]